MLRGDPFTKQQIRLCFYPQTANEILTSDAQVINILIVKILYKLHINNTLYYIVKRAVISSHDRLLQLFCACMSIHYWSFLKRSSIEFAHRSEITLFYLF